MVNRERVDRIVTRAFKEPEMSILKDTILEGNITAATMIHGTFRATLEELAGFDDDMVLAIIQRVRGLM